MPHRFQKVAPRVWHKSWCRYQRYSNSVVVLIFFRETLLEFLTPQLTGWHQKCSINSGQSVNNRASGSRMIMELTVRQSSISSADRIQTDAAPLSYSEGCQREKWKPKAGVRCLSHVRNPCVKTSDENVTFPAVHSLHPPNPSLSLRKHLSCLLE